MEVVVSYFKVTSVQKFTKRNSDTNVSSVKNLKEICAN
jgi:hypothetical protein